MKQIHKPKNENVNEVKEINIDEILIREGWNPRTKKNVKDVNSLMSSMIEIGLQQPIIINDKKEVIAGHRRLQAAKALMWKTIPCSIMITPTDQHERLIALDENLESKTLNDKDQEKALAEKQDIYRVLYPESFKQGPKVDGKEQESFLLSAEKLTGMSKSKINRMTKRVSDVTPEVREAYEDDKINAAQVDSLIKVEKKDQNKLLPKVIGLTKAETDLVVTDFNKRKEIKEESPKEASESSEALIKLNRLVKANKKLEVLIDDFILSGKLSLCAENQILLFRDSCRQLRSALERAL